jgi:predicted Zn-dependent peptidase
VGVVPRAGAAQSELRIGLVSAARATPDYYALVLLNAVLGGQFVSRINMRLRQEKGYTYGVRTAFDFRRGRGPFVLQTAVATDATASAVADALSELAGVAAARPVTADELALARASLAKGYPRGFETAAQVGRSVAHLALHDLPDSTFEDFIPRLDAVSVDEVTAVACKYLDRSRMAVVIVGDWDRISGLPSGLGDGQPVEITVEF